LPSFGERFATIKKLAEGGMAEVFLVRDLGASPPKLCVIKRILPGLAKNPDYNKMFHDEGRIASMMTHPNVVRIFETGRTADGPFLVMEYLAGQDLQDVTVRARRKGLFIPWEFAAGLIVEAAEGISYAHQLKGTAGQPLQIVHRDLTPSNVIVTWDGVVKVLDFGIAHAQHRMAKTQAGMVKGKAQYLAPEQITGKPLDGRVDQFALAVVLYQLLAGRPMFDQDNELACLHAILEGERPSVTAVRKDVPPTIDQVIHRATRVDPAARYPSMKAFRDALFDCLGGEVTREALSSRLRELFAGEFESHAQLMGRLASANAGTDELRNLYEKARHAEDAEAGSNARTELMPAPRSEPFPRRAALIGTGVAVVLALIVGLVATSKRGPARVVEGAITLRSNPPGAAVVLDGRATTWSTPVVLDHLSLGPHRLRLTHVERGAYEREVTLSAEDSTPTLDVTLPPPPGGLTVRVEPPDARVTVDGAPLPLVEGAGTAPELAAGSHRVRVEAAGYVAREVPAEITAGETSELEISLQEGAAQAE
jgi:serine/threonine protein kinase